MTASAINQHTSDAMTGIRPGARVVVAMSGGVDSSVTAALLKSQGYDVVGVTLQLYNQGAASGRRGACCAGQDIHDARRVADAIGIPHYVFDYEERFRKSVIDTFAQSYLDGETPIPCVACNQTVKFTDLLSTAREMGAEGLATGHYVDLRHTAVGPELYRAADPERDQSYFLFATTREQLGFLRFPLGAMTKPEVRDLAQSFALGVAQKPDSQDICFVPSGRYSDIIERLRPDAADPGDIVHVDGRVLGRHAGVVHFTVGQRKGLGIATGEPLFVVRIDARHKIVVVGPRAYLRTREIMLRNVNWLGSGPAPAIDSPDMRMHVRVRSTQPPQEATLSAKTSGMMVHLREGEHGVSAGQACVFYADETPRAQVLGGGWISGTRTLADGMQITSTPSETNPQTLKSAGRSA